MTPLRFAAPLLATALILAGVVSGAAHPAYVQDRDWDNAPRDNVQQLGYRDGMEGARHDFDNHRAPNPENRDEFRNPHVASELRHEYREAFRRGYQAAAAQLWGGAPVYGAPPEQNWGWGMRGLRSDAERRGYQEGIEEARKDFQFQRRPDADDHDEYRTPSVPLELADEYREGFMRGYTVAWSQLNGDTQWQDGDNFNRWAPPDRYDDIERRGFHDGVIGAQRDFGNHRRPDPANRDEYRHPDDLPRGLWHEYREGFRRGYEMAAIRLWGEGD